MYSWGYTSQTIVTNWLKIQFSCNNLIDFIIGAVDRGCELYWTYKCVYAAYLTRYLELNKMRNFNITKIVLKYVYKHISW